MTQHYTITEFEQHPHKDSTWVPIPDMEWAAFTQAFTLEAKDLTPNLRVFMWLSDVAGYRAKDRELRQYYIHRRYYFNRVLLNREDAEPRVESTGDLLPPGPHTPTRYWLWNLEGRNIGATCGYETLIEAAKILHTYLQSFGTAEYGHIVDSHNVPYRVMAKDGTVEPMKSGKEIDYDKPNHNCP